MTDNSPHNGRGENPPESPPELVPPDRAEAKQTTHPRTGQLLVLGLGLFLVLAAVAVLFLPSTPEAPPAVQSEAVQPAPQPQPPLPQQPKPDETGKETSRLLEQWLRDQAKAEAVNIAAWGGDSYAQAIAQARACEQGFADKQFSAAREACETAIGILEQLMGSREALLAEALRAGFLALENGQPQVATEQFQRALAIEADHKQAILGLGRAENLPEVLRLVEAGQMKEQADDAEGALQSYREANSLDPDFLPAREMLERLEASIADKQFNLAMSRALQALAKGDLSSAATALQQAQALNSNDPALKDLKLQLSQAQLAKKLDRLRQTGASLEKRENWPEALNACVQALALDSKAAFAANCRERVSQRIELDGRLQSFLSQPERLFADAVLKEARQVLAYASQVTPSGPRISSQIEQLGQLIRQAEATVEVVIHSDGLTDVVVFHVGRLGRFQEKTLVLRTGNYTATGSRNGYRDVRQTLKVRPESGNLVFTLSCQEPI